MNAIQRSWVAGIRLWGSALLFSSLTAMPVAAVNRAPVGGGNTGVCDVGLSRGPAFTVGALPAEPTAVPDTSERNHAQGGTNGRYAPSWATRKKTADVPAHAWKSWIETSPGTVRYGIGVHADGGALELRVDDRSLAREEPGKSLRAQVTLTAGVHAIKVKAMDNPVTLEKITLTGLTEESRPGD